ncbi:MAG: hypothetical protein A4S09_11415 [Proteobacteria bacterium SG_bin7]|nr:MAG: hypothetical protein A4S09_11415 [Proteobacteria bacterium SG_bin7]
MKNLIIFLTVVFCSTAFSAVAKKNETPVKDFDNVVATTVEALKLPGDSRMEFLAKLGPKAYKELMTVAFDSNYGMKVQWRALTAMAMLGKANAIPEVERALQHKDWYLRNAGLVVMNEVKPSKAREWAKKLIADPSLIVRTEAVGVLRKNRDLSARKLLWERLYDKQNFRGTQSLWVRRHIVETLGEMKTKGDEMKFLKVLDDKDKSLHPAALSALEALTQKHFGEPHDSVNQKAKLWRKFFANNKNKTRI